MLERAAPAPAQCDRRDGQLHVLHRDYETRSVLSLKNCGAHRYAADPQTAAWCCAYAINAEPVKLWTPGDAVPAEFREAAANPNWVLVAHNAAFEMAIEELLLAPRFGWPVVPLERQRCSMATALALALPARLEMLADVLELAQRKDAAGHRLMLAMSKPRRPRQGEDPSKIYWFDDPERLRRLYAYCQADVEAEREAYERLQTLPETEQAVWTLDQRINNRGFYLDQKLAVAAQQLAVAAAPEIDAELAELTGGAVTSIARIARLRDWLQQQGCGTENLDKKAVETLLKTELPPNVQRALELRQDGGQAAVKKVRALLDRVGGDGRVRGAFQYHKASTGRWAGVGAQVQNLKRPQTDDINAAIARNSAGCAIR